MVGGDCGEEEEQKARKERKTNYSTRDKQRSKGKRDREEQEKKRTGECEGTRLRKERKQDEGGRWSNNEDRNRMKDV